MMTGEEERPWDTLPAAALVTIFRKLGVEDRFKGGPLVCRSWKDASRNPRCWESMLPEGECPELHFIKNNQELATYRTGHLSIFGIRAFIERSGHCATTLYFWNRLRCPKLKHLSFRGCVLYPAEDGFLKLAESCPEMELLDLSDSVRLSSAALQQMGRCWPNLRGLRRNWFYYGPGEVSAMATSFPNLQLLNLYFTKLRFDYLSTILKSCTCLQFLDVTGCRSYPVKKFYNISHWIPEVLADHHRSYNYWYESSDFDLREYLLDDSDESELDEYDPREAVLALSSFFVWH